MDRISESRNPTEISVIVIELLEDNDPFQAMDIYDEIVLRNGCRTWH